MPLCRDYYITIFPALCRGVLHTLFYLLLHCPTNLRGRYTPSFLQIWKLAQSHTNGQLWKRDLNPSLPDSKVHANSLHFTTHFSSYYVTESPLGIFTLALPLMLYVFGFHDSILACLFSLTIPSLVSFVGSSSSFGS